MLNSKEEVNWKASILLHCQDKIEGGNFKKKRELGRYVGYLSRQKDPSQIK